MFNIDYDCNTNCRCESFTSLFMSLFQMLTRRNGFDFEYIVSFISFIFGYKTWYLKIDLSLEISSCC